jgi:hypothetical protein
MHNTYDIRYTLLFTNDKLKEYEKGKECSTVGLVLSFSCFVSFSAVLTYQKLWRYSLTPILLYPSRKKSDVPGILNLGFSAPSKPFRSSDLQILWKGRIKDTEPTHTIQSTVPTKCSGKWADIFRSYYCYR